MRKLCVKAGKQRSQLRAFTCGIGSAAHRRFKLLGSRKRLGSFSAASRKKLRKRGAPALFAGSYGKADSPGNGGGSSHTHNHGGADKHSIIQKVEINQHRTRGNGGKSERKQYRARRGKTFHSRAPRGIFARNVAFPTVSELPLRRVSDVCQLLMLDPSASYAAYRFISVKPCTFGGVKPAGGRVKSRRILAVWQIAAKAPVRLKRSLLLAQLSDLALPGVEHIKTAQCLKPAVCRKPVLVGVQ